MNDLDDIVVVGEMQRPRGEACELSTLEVDFLYLDEEIRQKAADAHHAETAKRSFRKPGKLLKKLAGFVRLGRATA